MPWLPNRLEQGTVADSLVACDQRDAFRPRHSPDQPINWVLWIVIRELRSDGRDLGRYRPDNNAGTEDEILKRVPDCAMCPEYSAGEKKSQFPYGDVGNG